MQIDLTVIGNVAGVIVSVSAACAIMAKVIKSTVSSTVTEATTEAVNTALEPIKRDIDNIKSEQEDQFTKLENKIKSVQDDLNQFKTSEAENNRVIKSAMLANIRDSINQSHVYYMRKKCIDVHALYVLEELFVSYQELHGNHFTKDQMEDLRKLPKTEAMTSYVSDRHE